MRNRTIRAVAMAAICLFSSLFSAESFAQISGKSVWTGTLKPPGASLRLEFHFSSEDDGYSGHLISLDQGRVKLDLDKIEWTKEKLSFKIPRINGSFSGKSKKGESAISGSFSQNGMNFPLKISKKDSSKKDKLTLLESWAGELNLGGMKPKMQFRIMKDSNGKKKIFFDSLTEGRTDMPATIKKDAKKLRFEVSSVGLVYEGELNKDGTKAEGTMTQGGREMELNLRRMVGETSKVKTWDDRPQKPKGPFPYKSIDVTVKNESASIDLAGTLTIPKGAGPFPAIVLVSGSGPQDRDETLMNHKPFLVLADYFSRRGIAVLRYDDRGCFKSKGSFKDATTKDFATDASAAVEFLRTYKGIDAGKIGIVGHSEGGLIAPMVSAERGDLAFIILMAGTGVDGATILESQSAAMINASGESKEEIAAGITMNKALMELLRSSDLNKDGIGDEIKKVLRKTVKTLPNSLRKKAEKELESTLPGVVKRMQSKWMRFFLQHDPAPVLRKVKCPTMAIIGSKDLQVLPKLNMPAIEKALELSEAKEFTMVEIPNLNHLFQECKTGHVNEYADIDQTFSPKAMKSMGDWILKTVK